MGLPVYAVEDPTDLDLEKAAVEIFPLFIETENAVLRREYASALADVIGTPGEFHKYVQGNQGDLEARRDRLFAMFRDNAKLLVAKTWVDAHDGAGKEKALREIESFSSECARGEHERALGHFVNIADEIAQLLFGESPSGRGFMDYVFRIDAKLGMFYWFVDRLREQDPAKTPDDLKRLEILVGVYSLSSF